MKRHPHVKLAREVLKGMDFEFFVRRFDSGLLWAGPVYGSAKRMKAMLEPLEKAGFKCTCKGTPGTVGEFIIDMEAPQ